MKNLDEKTQIVLEAIQQNPKLSIKDISKEHKIFRRKVAAITTELKNKCLIVEDGNRYNFSFQWSDVIHRATTKQERAELVKQKLFKLRDTKKKLENWLITTPKYITIESVKNKINKVDTQIADLEKISDNIEE